MKVEVKDDLQEFQPVTLEVTIESESELRTLYTLTNTSVGEIHSLSNNEEFDVKSDMKVETHGLWQAINNVCQKRLK